MELFIVFVIVSILMVIGVFVGIVVLVWKLSSKTLFSTTSGRSGWSHEYSSTVTQERVTIPESGRYKISIKRPPFVMGGFKMVFTTRPFSEQVNFSVIQIETGQEIRFVNSGFGASSGTGRPTVWPAGVFDVPQGGDYLITNLRVSPYFLPEDQIVVTKA